MTVQPQAIQPEPIPTGVEVHRLGTPNGPVVKLSFHHLAGSTVLFFPAEAAKELARGIVQAATGITLPDGPTSPLGRLNGG